MAFLLAVELFFLGTGFAIVAVFPSAPGYAATIGSELAILIFSIVVLVKLGWIGKVGFNRPREWRNLRSLWLPAAIVAFIFVLGLGSSFSFETALIAISAAILVGFSEESVFRGVMLQSLLPSGVLRAVIVSALAFALLHLNNLFQAGSSSNPEAVLVNVAYAFLFGVAMASFRIATKTIWPAITFHTLTDIPGLLAIVWGTTSIGSSSPSPAGIVIEIGLGALMAWYGLRSLGRNMRIQRSIGT